MPAAITIRDVKTFVTQPQRERLVIVKVETSEPGLYGLGCATFTQRAFAVQAALERHFKPLLLGRDVSRIEEIWQTARANGYWRNGPILNNALSGVDQALWDILGKRAGLPLYMLLGGKCRDAVATYSHADGAVVDEVIDNAQRLLAEGYRHVRLQLRQYGGGAPDQPRPEGALEGAYYDPRKYARETLKLLEAARQRLPESIELIHDVHERLPPSDAVQFAKDVEQFKLFFLEDLLSPEQLEWLPRVRQVCSTPLALGELFNHPFEWLRCIEQRAVDFIRMHVSQMGGISPARNIAAMAAQYGIRTARHGPADTSPVGHMANLHLELSSPNFGIHEWCRFPDPVYAIFPGLSRTRDGYLYASEAPGLGIDFVPELAAKYPPQDYVEEWTQARLPDGSPALP
jgi:mannonate dehydratase